VSAVLCLLAMRHQGDTTPAESVLHPARAGVETAQAPSQASCSPARLSERRVLSLEVVWTRLASFTLGNRCFAFSTFLAWVLLWLAAGSWLAGRLVYRFAGRSSLLLPCCYSLGRSVSAAPSRW